MAFICSKHDWSSLGDACPSCRAESFETELQETRQWNAFHANQLWDVGPELTRLRAIERDARALTEYLLDETHYPLPYGGKLRELVCQLLERMEPTQ